MEFRFRAAAPAGEQLAIRWNDGAWVTGGVGEATIGEFPSPLPARLNDGFRTDWDPMWADLGPISFYSDQFNVPEPSALVLLIFALITGLFGVLLSPWRRRDGMRMFSIPCPHWRGDKTMLRNVLVYPLVVLLLLIGPTQVPAASFEL